MSCDRWNEAIVGKLYEEIEPAEGRALDEHLAGCASCRGRLAEWTRVRTVLREHEPEVPRAPRVVLLRDTPRFRPALLAATLAATALLAGVGAGAGYAVGRQSRAEVAVSPAPANASPATLDPATEALVRREVESRLAAMESRMKTAAPAATEPALTGRDLETALAKFERKLDGNRAAELDYLLGQIEASEVRTGARIGQTNQALRYVALASNPNVTER